MAYRRRATAGNRGNAEPVKSGGSSSRGAAEHQLVLADRTVSFRLKRGSSRGIWLSIRGDEGLIVAAGPRASMTDIETVLRRHARWLEKRLREYERARRQLLADDGTPRTLYRGQWIPIHLASQTNTCRLERGTLQVPIQGDPRSLLRDWYRSQARKELGAMSSLLAAEMGVRYQRLQIRLQRTRWGSYSVRGTLSLNWRLLMAPPEVSRYVVVHELAHARHMNHSSSFWRTVQRFCPEYRQHIDWLRENRLLLEALSSFSHLTSGSRKDSAPR